MPIGHRLNADGYFHNRDTLNGEYCEMHVSGRKLKVFQGAETVHWYRV